jgi:hypothetical protein
MITDNQIPEPLLFNPLKHHLGFIRNFIDLKIDESQLDIKDLTKELKHLGTSVMDLYSGMLPVRSICNEIKDYLKQKDLLNMAAYADWAGLRTTSYKIISISDGSQWTLKYHDNQVRFVHVFPARNSQHSFRVKSNTLKSAMIYYILIGKDLVTGNDLNKVRPLLGLSPIKNTLDTEAILEMIEILRK